MTSAEPVYRGCRRERPCWRADRKPDGTLPLTCSVCVAKINEIIERSST